MVAPIFAAIAAAIASIGIATLVQYGFWMVITYFIYDVANDLSGANKINTEDEARRNKLADETAEDLVEDGTWTPEQLLSYLEEAAAAREEEKGSILDQLSRSLGIATKDLIWIVAGILLFSLLRG